MSSNSSSIIQLTDKDGNIINTTSSGTFTSITIPNKTPGQFTGTIINGTSLQPMNLDPLHVDKVWSVGSRKSISENVSDNKSVSDNQWMSLLRKHIQLYVTDKELTDFLMEDALKDK